MNAAALSAIASLSFLTACGTEPTTIVTTAATRARTAAVEAPIALYFHGVGNTANPASLVLDATPPTATSQKYQDSPSVRFANGNSWALVGTWSAAPGSMQGSLSSVEPLTVWAGLKNSDDIGTNFDIRAEVSKNGTVLATGETYCIRTITRNPDLAKQVSVAIGSFAATSFNGSTDFLAVTVRVRIGTLGGVSCGGHSNAAGLRTYFDAMPRPAGVGLTFAPPVTAFALSAGGASSCAVPIGGSGMCWGINVNGQLGDGTYVSRNMPVPVVDGGLLVSISTGQNLACGLTTAGAAYCWGANTFGAIGDGTNINRPTPVPVVGGIAFSMLAIGGETSCGLAVDGTAYCWGRGMGGCRLGDGTCGDRNYPAPVAGSERFVTLSQASGHTCGITPSGDVFCWGDNRFGAVGDGTTADADVPKLVIGGLKYSAIGAGELHTCGLTTSGLTYCWGRNDWGQLGDGTTDNHPTPTLVPTAPAFATLSISGQHSCGVTAAGYAYCWGHNAGGLLGDGTVDTRLSPVLGGGGMQWAALATGGVHTCGIATAGGLYCWGSNSFGQVGDGTNTDRLLPVLVIP